MNKTKPTLRTTMQGCRAFAAVSTLLLGLISCSSSSDLQAEKDNAATLVVAHGSGGGHWQRNSRTAVASFIAAREAGEARGQAQAIEVDLVLSKDLQLVLSHDPWIDKLLCRTTGGRDPGHVLIRDLSLREIQSNFVCGYRNLPELPDAQLLPESIMSFAEMLELVAEEPELAIYLDIKIQQGATAGVDDYALALEQAFRKRPVSNPVYLEGPTTKALLAYRDHVSREFHGILSYPPFYAGENWTIAGALAMVRTYFDADLPVAEALAASTDYIASPPQVLSERAIEALREAGIGIVLYTANDSRSFKDFCALLPDLLITDYPELGPCRRGR